MKFNCFAKSALLLFIGVIVSLFSFSQVIIIPTTVHGNTWDNTRPAGWETTAFVETGWLHRECLNWVMEMVMRQL